MVHCEESGTISQRELEASVPTVLCVMYSGQPTDPEPLHHIFTPCRARQIPPASDTSKYTYWNFISMELHLINFIATGFGTTKPP